MICVKTFTEKYGDQQDDDELSGRESEPYEYLEGSAVRTAESQSAQSLPIMKSHVSGRVSNTL